MISHDKHDLTSYFSRVRISLWDIKNAAVEVWKRILDLWQLETREICIKKISFPGISPIPLVKSEEKALILEGVFPSRELCMVEKNWNIDSLCCLATKIFEFQPIHNFTGKPFQLRFLFDLISVRYACSAKWTLKGSWETTSLTISPLCCHKSWTNHSCYNAEKGTSQILILLELIAEISC